MIDVKAAMDAADALEAALEKCAAGSADGARWAACVARCLASTLRKFSELHVPDGAPKFRPMTPEELQRAREAVKHLLKKE